MHGESTSSKEKWTNLIFRKQTSKSNQNMHAYIYAIFLGRIHRRQLKISIAGTAGPISANRKVNIPTQKKANMYSFTI